jgi:hypothetical protein
VVRGVAEAVRVDRGSTVSVVIAGLADVWTDNHLGVFGFSALKLDSRQRQNGHGEGESENP